MHLHVSTLQSRLEFGARVLHLSSFFMCLRWALQASKAPPKPLAKSGRLKVEADI